MPQAKLSSAEWIVEAPSSSGVLPLANFGSASFGHVFTRQSGTCDATVSGIGGPTGNVGPIGAFNTADVIQINMVTSTDALKAMTNSLSPDGSSFTVAFESKGP